MHVYIVPLIIVTPTGSLYVGASIFVTYAYLPQQSAVGNHHKSRPSTPPIRHVFPKEGFPRGKHAPTTGAPQDVPTHVLGPGHVQHTPPAPDSKIRLNRSPLAKVLVTNSSEVDLHSRQDYNHIYPTQTHASISTIQHGMTRGSRSSGIKEGHAGSSHQQH